MKMKCPEWMNPTQKIEFYNVPENEKHYLYGTRGGWVKDTRNPILTDKYGVLFDVAVLQDDGKFKMWLSWRTQVCIAYSESSDGITWTAPIEVLKPIPSSSWEAHELNRPTVIKKDGLYKMWYSGQMLPYREAGYSSIGYAESEDGIHWRRLAEQPVMTYDTPWEAHSIMCPHVIFDNADNLYKMWYSGGNNHEPDAIGYAESEDGLHWRKYAENPVLEKSAENPWEQYKVLASYVLKHDDWFYMFYIGHMHEERASVGLARSRDGKTNWIKHPANPLIAPDKNSWDDLSVYKPCVLRVDNQWMMWYNGAKWDKDLWAIEQIGIAYLNHADFGF